ncbi:hypothetical protein HDV03_000809 [Kappamyces sp. JEL0829]|nr:hypothetical protein HDV03_000809 [Kappamyces sp. JEL0829]KAJ3367448.1 hypothetical protein HDU91_001414 [Kappamyces sp. JEL0680]
MHSTAPISAGLKHSILPALLSFDTAVGEAAASQQELRETLERLSAEMHFLSGLLQSPPPLDSALVKCIIIRKRIDNLKRKLQRVSANLLRINDKLRPLPK